MGVEWRHLKVVIAAAQHGSLRRAAAALGTKQSTLSRGIRQVEERLDIALFSRTSCGVRLTPTGVQFVRMATRLLEDLDALIASTGAIGRGEAGLLALGMITSQSMGSLRAALGDYVRQHPAVEIRFAEKSRIDLMLGLGAGALDLVVVTGEATEQNTEFLSLWSERIFVAVPHEHPLATKAYIYWADLKEEIFIISRRGCGPDLRDIAVAKLAAIGSRPKIEYQDANWEALLSLVSAGRGLGLQCHGTLRTAFAGVVYREVHDASGPCWISYSAYWKMGNTNPALASFIVLLRTHCSLLSPSRVPDT